MKGTRHSLPRLLGVQVSQGWEAALVADGPFASSAAPFPRASFIYKPTLRTG